MTDKEQRERWSKYLNAHINKYYPNDYEKGIHWAEIEAMQVAWFAACEFMHENMSQSRYNFWKLTRIQKKKINVLVEALGFINVEFLTQESAQIASKALQKIKEIDASGSEVGACDNESEGK